MTTSPRTAGDYENLRAAVLGAQPVRGPDLGILRHRGMTSWLKTPSPALTPSGPDLSLGARLGNRPPVATELTRLIANIVVALATESAYG